MEAPDERQINTVTQQATQENSEKPKPTCHHCIKPNHYRNQCRQFKREKKQARNNANNADKTNYKSSGQTKSNSNNKITNNTNANNSYNQKDRRPRSDYHPVTPVVKGTIPPRNVTLERRLRTDRRPGTDDRNDKTKPNRDTPKASQMGMFKLQPKLQARNATDSLRSCI